MVDQLLALEERRVLTARPAEQAVPHKVKLPPFWEKDSATWFLLVEAVIEDNHVRNPWVRYRKVLMCWRGPQGAPEPDRHHGGPLRGAEEQTGGASHPQPA